MKKDELQKKTLIDQSYFEQSLPLHLSVLIGKKSSFAALLDAKNKKYVGILSSQNSQDYDTSALLEDASLKKLSISSIGVYIQNQDYTLVPNAWYQANNIDKVLEFNLGPIDSTVECFSQAIDSIDSQILFTCPKDIVSSWKSEFPEISIKHSIQTLLDSYSPIVQNAEEHIFVHFYEGSFDISIYKNQQLFSCNSFDYQTTEDFLYFFLYALEQENINRESSKFYFLGLIDVDSPIYDLAYRYISSIEFIKEPRSISYSSPLKESDLHHNYCLLNQYLCE